MSFVVYISYIGFSTKFYATDYNTSDTNFNLFDTCGVDNDGYFAYTILNPNKKNIITSVALTKNDSKKFFIFLYFLNL